MTSFVLNYVTYQNVTFLFVYTVIFGLLAYGLYKYDKEASSYD
jgi:hypothetical protein